MSNKKYNRTEQSQEDEKNTLWGGRFTEATDTFVQRFTSSISFDYRLYQHDINGSIAHAMMLNKAGILTDKEKTEILTGLETIYHDIKDGNFKWSIELEDVHMNIEAALTSRIGDLGKKLHTGRSRNDQIATDFKLFIKDQIDLVVGLITELQRSIVNLAEQEAGTIMPGFTHLQAAQPISFGHHLMAWYEMLDRDYSRLIDCKKRANFSPLGSAALAGTTYNIDREYSAELLGFEAPTRNSLDSVSDRDFAIELASAVSLIMMHLSRFSEELILWSSSQFSFVEIPDRFCTGSSIMPQKKNPDVPELVRGKSGRVFGHLTSLLTLMKSQPLAYNKDNQEDKEPVFDLLDTVKDCLLAYSNMIPAIICNHEEMEAAAIKGHTTATDLADYLVIKGIPFRDAHEIVGKAVGYAIEEKKDLSSLDLSELKRFSALISEDVFDIITVKGSVNARNHTGGTAISQVLLATKAARKNLDTRENK